MSTPESNRNSSQAKPESNQPGKSIPPKAQHSSDKRKPLPFDDNGTPGEIIETTNPPKIDGMGG